jgi:hypothetical protein
MQQEGTIAANLNKGGKASLRFDSLHKVKNTIERAPPRAVYPQ